jgi:predicted Zn finger-like uncharacterized protein
MPIQIHCPACSQSYTLADSQAGKRVRCKSCSETFLVPASEQICDVVAVEEVVPQRRRDFDDEYDYRPRRRPVRSQGVPAWVWIVIGGAAFLLLAGGVVAIVLTVGGNKVTQENYNKLRDGMTEAEVRSILGRPTEETDPTTALGRHAMGSKNPLAAFQGFLPSAKVLVWKSGKNTIMVILINGQLTGRMGNFQN